MDDNMKAFVINLDNRPSRLEMFRKNIFPFEVERISAIQMLDGAMGCALTHFKILKEQTMFPFAIFEDDCVMIEPWSLVEKAISQLPEDWDALWLGGTVDTPLKRYSDNLFRLKKTYCTHAIIYNSQKIVDYILNNFDTWHGRKIIDIFYYSDVQEKFNCFITYPMAALQAEGFSDIMNRTPDDSEYQWRLYCYNKFTK
jgi:GR25 family glycosyltransferase involved in LPS biosynthesis